MSKRKNPPNLIREDDDLYTRWLNWSARDLTLTGCKALMACGNFTTLPCAAVILGLPYFTLYHHYKFRAKVNKTRKPAMFTFIAPFPTFKPVGNSYRMLSEDEIGKGTVVFVEIDHKFIAYLEKRMKKPYTSRSTKGVPNVR